MNKRFLSKLRMVSATTAAVVVGLGAGTIALAALTFGATSVSSDGAYDLDAAVRYK